MWVRGEGVVLITMACAYVQAVETGDCDCHHTSTMYPGAVPGELAQIRSENRGKEEGTSRAEPPGRPPQLTHLGSTTPAQGPSPFANKTSCLLLFETRRLRVPSSCLFVFMTQSPSQLRLWHSSPSQAPGVGIFSSGLLKNTTACPSPSGAPAPAVCSRCPGLPCLGPYVVLAEAIALAWTKEPSAA